MSELLPARKTRVLTIGSRKIVFANLTGATPGSMWNMRVGPGCSTDGSWQALTLRHQPQLALALSDRVTYRPFSPRRAPSRRNCRASVVLPVPGFPLDKVQPIRIKPSTKNVIQTGNAGRYLLAVFLCVRLVHRRTFGRLPKFVAGIAPNGHASGAIGSPGQPINPKPKCSRRETSSTWSGGILANSLASSVFSDLKSSPLRVHVFERQALELPEQFTLASS